MIKLVRSEGLQFIAEDEHNHNIVVDTDKKHGGLDEGFHPLELILVSLAGCMGMDIISILQKKGGKIDRFEVFIEADKAPEHPKRYEKITVKFTCEGDYDRKDLVRSFELSRDKYCGALATLQSRPDIEFIV